MNNTNSYFFLILIFLISTFNTIDCYSIGKSQCQRGCNSDYDNCYKNPNPNYSECDSTHRKCMSSCDVIGCKDDCDNTDRNCSINRRGYGCNGFNIFSCYSLCQIYQTK